MSNDSYSPFDLFGIECGQGWEKLYKPVIERINEINKTRTPEDQIIIDQIKEKFGTLRIYVSNAPKEIYDMIDEAEQRSQNVCEDCGFEHQEHVRTGYVGKTGWIRTLCNKCRKKYETT